MGYNNRLKVDLHVHSTASDGSFTPGEIIELASELNLYAISITDHDSVDGYKSALASGIPESLSIISGVEISAAFPPPFFSENGSLHLLGYGFNIHDPNLIQTLYDQQKARNSRNPEIIKKLNALGLDVSLSEVELLAGKKEISRPHIAKCLIGKGFAKNIDDAFDRYLGKGQCAYVEKAKIPAEKAISLIKEAGGIPVMAHPVLIQRHTDLLLEELIEVLTGCGLEGLEVYYPGQSRQETRFFENLAGRFNLLMTGGSDFHGDINPQIRMGSGYKGDIDVPAELFERLRGALLKKRGEKSENNLSDLESVLNYKFSDRRLIETALCHRSFANENEGVSNNERFEFLGDAVLSLVISHMLMTRFPNLNEGGLSSIRSSLVNEKRLAEIASALNLGAFILLGKGESKTDGRHKKSILADTMEAVIAAIYMDGGFEKVFEVLKIHFTPLIDSISEARPVFDYKSRIQEMVQNQGLQVPDYRIINELGPDHNKTFEICLTAFGICTKGRAKSKKAAEQEAAKKAFETLVAQP